MERDVLKPHTNVRDFLISKLNVDEDVLDKAIEKSPQLLRVQVPKLDQVINILQENGLTGDKIIRYPRVFYYSKETLCKRLETLREAGIPPRVNLITFDQSSFDIYVNYNMRKKKL